MIFFGRIPPWPAEVVFTPVMFSPVIFGPVIFMLITLTLATPNTAMAAGWTDLWLTPDQQAQRMAEDDQWAEAAGKFTRPEHIGYAWYRAGEFEKAAAALGRAPGAAPAYNRGNALVMLGRYETAIDAYQRALELRPDWVEAEQNMALARIRLAALAPPEDDAGGTGGMLGADEMIIDTSGRVAAAQSEEVIQDEASALSEEALRALWLRRVDAGPQQFLAIRFQRQLARQEAAARDE